jgi:hypothetical protein
MESKDDICIMFKDDLIKIEVERIERIIRIINKYVTGEKPYKSHAVKQRSSDKKKLVELNERLDILKNKQDGQISAC